MCWFATTRQSSFRAGYTLFQWTDPLIDALAPHPHVKIILSSSWVGVFGYDKSLAALPEALHERVIGSTYTDQNWYSKTRYLQIVEHVEKHQIPRWLAIDDDVIGWPADQRHSLVEPSQYAFVVFLRCVEYRPNGYCATSRRKVHTPMLLRSFALPPFR